MCVTGKKKSDGMSEERESAWGRGSKVGEGEEQRRETHRGEVEIAE